jgi:hypothetical protein
MRREFYMTQLRSSGGATYLARHGGCHALSAENPTIFMLSYNYDLYDDF